MSSHAPGGLERYQTVLEAVGLSASQLRRLHDRTDTPAEAIIEECIDTPETLLETIAASPYGIDLPRFYSSIDAAAAIEAVATAHGYDADVTPEDGRSFSVVVTDSLSDTTEQFTIEYPDTELGPDNFPAVAAAIERVVFDDDGLSFVLLAGRDRWRLALVDAADLEALQTRFGRRIDLDGTSLLRPETPIDYVVDPPLPGVEPDDRPEPPDNETLAAWLESVTEQPTEAIVERLHDEDDPSDAAVDAVVDDDLPEPADSPFDTSGPRTHVSEQTVDSLNPVEDTDESDGFAGGSPTTISTDGIDEVFEELEEAAPGGDDGGPIVDRVEADTPPEPDDPASDEPLGGGPDKTVQSESVDDILDTAADSFETFVGDGAETHVEQDPDALLPGEADDDPLSRIEQVDPEHESTSEGLRPDDADDVMADLVDESADGVEAFPAGSDSSAAPDSSGEDSSHLDRTIGLSDRVAEQLATEDDSPSDTGGEDTTQQVQAAETATVEPSASGTPDKPKAGETTDKPAADDPAATTPADEPTSDADEDPSFAAEDTAEHAAEDEPQSTSKPSETQPSGDGPEETAGDEATPHETAADDPSEPWSVVEITQDDESATPNSTDSEPAPVSQDVETESTNAAADPASHPEPTAEPIEGEEWRTGPRAFDVDNEPTPASDDDGGVLNLSRDRYDNRSAGEDDPEPQTGDTSTAPTDTEAEQDDEDGVVDRLRSMVGR